jgi:hypothetical protein
VILTLLGTPRKTLSTDMVKEFIYFRVDTHLTGHTKEAPVHRHGKGANGVVVLDLELGIATTAAVAHISE